MSVAVIINPIVSKKTQSPQHEALLYYCSKGNLALEHRPLDTDQSPEYVDNNPAENPGSIKQPGCFAAVQHGTDIVVYGILKVLVNPKTPAEPAAEDPKVPQYLVATLTPTPNPLAPWDGETQSSKALVPKNYAAIAATIGDTEASDSVYFLQDTSTSQTGTNDSGPYLTECRLNGNGTPTFETITNCKPKAVSKLAAVYSEAMSGKVVFYQSTSGTGLGLGYKVEGEDGEYLIPNTDCLDGTPIAAFSFDSQPDKTGGRTIFVYFVNSYQHICRVDYHAPSNKWTGVQILDSHIKVPTGSGLAAVLHEEKLHGIVYYLKDKRYVAVKDNLIKRNSDDRGDGGENDEE